MQDLSTEDSNLPILDNRFILIKKIGSGATCSVKLAKDLNDNQHYAVKILKNKLQTKSSSAQNEKIFNAEINNLKLINHKNIIRIIEGSKGIIKKPSGESKTVDYIVLEMATNGELFDFIYFAKKGFSEYYARVLFSQLLDGIEACHLSGVVHRDLKTENIMMNESWVLKVADFGYATLLQGKSGNGILTTPLGTLSYAAPEILNKKPYKGDKADIFSMGVVLFVLVTGKLPFGKALIFDAYYRNFIRNDVDTFWQLMNPKIPTSISDEFRSLISSILANDPNERPTIQEIRSHKWFKKNEATIDELKEEMEKRKEIVVKMREIERTQKEQEKTNRVNKTGGYRGENDEEIILPSGNRIIDDFVEGGNPCKLKITNEADPEEVLKKVYEFFEKTSKSKNVKVSENNYKINIVYDLEKELKDLGLNVEKLELDVLISKKDEDFVVELVKKGGEKMEFYEIFENLCNELSK